MTTWQSQEPPEIQAPRGLGWLRLVVRFLMIALTIFGLMLPMVLARFLGFKRVAETLVQLACTLVLKIMGLRVAIHGRPMEHPGAIVANHSTWLDIFTLNAVQRAYFVSKAEVSRWPVIGAIARSTGTVFIERRAADAARQKAIFLDRLVQGDRLLFFPEGTSTDGARVLSFRSSLFAALFDAELKQQMWVQPVSVFYRSPNNTDPRFYGWWGDMEFAPHFVQVLASAQQGEVVIRFGAPICVADVENRKQLARLCEQAVRDGFKASAG